MAMAQESSVNFLFAPFFLIQDKVPWETSPLELKEHMVLGAVAAVAAVNLLQEMK
jgi:hypothetical protein